jgi:hypothetical protein
MNLPFLAATPSHWPLFLLEYIDKLSRIGKKIHGCLLALVLPCSLWYNPDMKRRRTLGPKREKNRSALVKFLLWALVAAVAGIALNRLLAYLLRRFAPNADPTSLLAHLPDMMGILAFLVVLALVFFGVRAYLSGLKARYSLQHNRLKIKHFK